MTLLHYILYTSKEEREILRYCCDNIWNRLKGTEMSDKDAGAAGKTSDSIIFKNSNTGQVLDTKQLELNRQV
jgi:hypothetical protein